MKNIFLENFKELANKFFNKKYLKTFCLATFSEETMIQVYDAKKGNRNCRFSTVMMCSFIILRDKLKNGSYNFFGKVYNLPSSIIMSDYNSLGSNQANIILYSVLRRIQTELDSSMRLTNGFQCFPWNLTHVISVTKSVFIITLRVCFPAKAFSGNVLTEDFKKWAVQMINRRRN